MRKFGVSLILLTVYMVISVSYMNAAGSGNYQERTVVSFKPISTIAAMGHNPNLVVLNKTGRPVQVVLDKQENIYITLHGELRIFDKAGKFLNSHKWKRDGDPSVLEFVQFDKGNIYIIPASMIPGQKGSEIIEIDRNGKQRKIGIKGLFSFDRIHIKNGLVLNIGPTAVEVGKNQVIYKKEAE